MGGANALPLALVLFPELGEKLLLSFRLDIRDHVFGAEIEVKAQPLDVFRVEISGNSGTA